MVVGRGVVGEDRQCNDYHYHTSREEFSRILRLRCVPLLDIDCIEGPVRFFPDICWSIVDSPSISCLRCSSCIVVNIFLRTPWLHILVCFVDKEGSKYNCNKKQNRAYHIRKQIWKSPEESVCRKEIRKILTRSSKATTYGRPYHCTERPYEWHHSKCL